MSQVIIDKIGGYHTVADGKFTPFNGTTQYDFVPPHTVEARHVLAAIPGDTLRQKLDWVQAQLKPPTCDCGGGCGCGCNSGIIIKVKEAVDAWKSNELSDYSALVVISIIVNGVRNPTKKEIEYGLELESFIP